MAPQASFKVAVYISLSYCNLINKNIYPREFLNCANNYANMLLGYESVGLVGLVENQERLAFPSYSPISV